MEQTITVKAHTLEEARELAKGQVPRGLAVLAERMEAEGTEDTVRATAETAEGAFALALKAVPAGTRVISKELLTEPERKQVVLQAHGEDKARAILQGRLSRTQVLESITVQQPGKKGVLGVGRKASVYEAVILQQAVVEVTHRGQATFAFTVGPQRDYQMRKVWGGYGQRKGNLHAPVGIAVDWRGNVYVTDNGLILNDVAPVTQRFSRVIKFDADGRWLGEWGEHGEGDGQFLEAQSIAITAQDDVLVADGPAGRIHRFDPRGHRIATWGSKGTGAGQLSGGKLHLAVAPDGSVYVSDQRAHRLLRFAVDGTFLTAWGDNGSGEGQFERPEGVAVDAQGCVYVADGGNDRVQKFDADGGFIARWGGRGMEAGQFQVPRGIVVDVAGCVYVCSAGIPVQKFDADGQFIAQWRTHSKFKTERPDDLALGPSGAVYLLEGINRLVYRFE